MHISVLKDESIDGLGIRPKDIVLDGTLGGGGHTLEIIKRFGQEVKIIGLDLDKDAILRVKNLIKDFPHDVSFRTIGFQEMNKVLDELNVVHIDKILLDLGLSSFQLEEAGRGFSFLKDEPLLMTMKKDPSESDLTAREIVNNWDESSLADIIFGFGEEKHSRRIAKEIIEARKIKKIETTFDLVQIIKNAVGGYYKKEKIHPATRTFQALRIATNSELSNLEKVIEDGFNRLSEKGRIAIITFHSLEDRIVKNKFKKLKEDGYANIITKKPIVPSAGEIINNPRSRSAKLRIIEKI
ncbi:MAG: 16S rRNA (cytosine(1402)-N(4))-methyltransferase RsmH [Candidatus Pacebacteria bacterium]|nr:16S rRNA (cytosine(1402)-N(4))-methyltransferase RsmH [Candidatus Paceibacterota bacterium]